MPFTTWSDKWMWSLAGVRGRARRLQYSSWGVTLGPQYVFARSWFRAYLVRFIRKMDIADFALFFASPTYSLLAFHPGLTSVELDYREGRIGTRSIMSSDFWEYYLVNMWVAWWPHGPWPGGPMFEPSVMKMNIELQRNKQLSINSKFEPLNYKYMILLKLIPTFLL